MAKRSRVNKTQAVLDYLKDHPAAVSSEIAEALKQRKIKITTGYVANIKTKFKIKRPGKGADSTAVELPAPGAMAPERPAKVGDTVTLDQIRVVAQKARAIGGFVRMQELVGLIRELGGPKKFNELLDAMSAGDMDGIPF